MTDLFDWPPCLLAFGGATTAGQPYLEIRTNKLVDMHSIAGLAGASHDAEQNRCIVILRGSPMLSGEQLAAVRSVRSGINLPKSPYTVRKYVS
jgi:hypothetical protein